MATGMQSLTGLHARFLGPEPSQTLMRKYYIPDHVHFAIEGDRTIFLDLRKDQYSLLMGEQARIFCALVTRTPHSSRRIVLEDRSISDDHSIALQNALVTDLLESGVLSLQTSASTELISQPPQFPQDNLLDPLEASDTEISLRYLWTFLVSCMIAKWRLSRTSIETTVRTVRRRKLLRESNDCFDMNKARQLVSIYNRFRPLLPHDYLCLFDSLSLIEFLARYNCYPNWIFAVHLEPWGAHCWVQHGTTAFNEDVDWARTFLQVMSI